MLSITRMDMDHARLGKEARSCIAETAAPCLTWAAHSTRNGANQAAYRLVVGETDTGWVNTSAMEVRLPEGTLAGGAWTPLVLVLRDDMGEESAPYITSICCGGREWTAPWIGEPDAPRGQPILLRKRFTLPEGAENARLYASGTGYAEVCVNGEPVDDARLDPAHSDYSKTMYYSYYPEISLKEGENEITILVAPGWRDNFVMHKNDWLLPKFPFDGPLEASCTLLADLPDGSAFTLETGDDWEAGGSYITAAGIMDGETWDMNVIPMEDARPAKLVSAPGGKMRLMRIPPIRDGRCYSPLAMWWDGEGWVVDFGQNIAGVVCVPVPPMKKGESFTLTHAEELDAEGRLFTATLRLAKATDTFVSGGIGADPDFFEPRFTYHGFRYARIAGVSRDTAERIMAVELHTDVENGGFFRCGNALVTRIHEMVHATERANIHSILTDCPQRDERLGWLNDTTVRFEDTPYLVDIGALFPKVLRDIIDSADERGAIAFTAPRAEGTVDGDPVCSSFLIAALESLMHTGNPEAVAESYPAMAAWEDFLLSGSEDYIVTRGGVGDWAGPADCCRPREDGTPGTNSAVTPEPYMNTGFSYLNLVLLARFAKFLGMEEEAARREKLAERVKQAFLTRWYDPETGIFGTGSEGCLSFALWLGLAPEPEKTAKRLHEAVVEAGMRLTTGNLCSRYILDALTDHGYGEDAWALMTRDTWPSLGYMIQQEATTVWERFELTPDPSMNSHAHPMYGACDKWMYSHILGMVPTAPGWRRFTVKPFIPKELMSAQGAVETPAGRIHVRWAKRYGKLTAMIEVPMGCVCEAQLPGGEAAELQGGFYTLSVPCGEE